MQIANKINYILKVLTCRCVYAYRKIKDKVEQSTRIDISYFFLKQTYI